MTNLVFYSEEDLLVRLIAGREGEPRPFVFLVGSPLTAPVGANKGVPGVPTMIERVKALLKRSDIPPMGSSNPYQAAFEALLGQRGPDVVNDLVRSAVLEASVLGDRELVAAARRGDMAACRKLEHDSQAWSLSPGVEALGLILTEFPHSFGETLLTTNFDPLVQVAIRKAQGRTWQTRLAGEGSLEQAEGEGCHVIYLHGTWYSSDALHTPTQLTMPRRRLKSSLQRLLDKVTLVVLAYGAWNDVFTEALTEVVSDPGARPDVLWSFYPKVDAEIARSNEWLFERLTPQLGRRVNLYAGIDCHVLLPKLWEKLQPFRPTLLEGRVASSDSRLLSIPSLTINSNFGTPRSPFSPGHAIRRDEDFVGRHAQREILQDALSRGQSAQILGEWRMGKTSLLRWVERHASEWQHRPIAWVNGQGVAGRSPVGLVWEVGRSLGRVAEVKRNLEEHADVPSTRAAEEALIVLLPMVLLVDEAAALAQDAHQFDKEFLDYLRALGEDGELVWVSASRIDLRKLFVDSGLTSTFLNNVVKPIVGQLEETASRELLARGGFVEDTIKAIMEEVGGFAAGLQWLADGIWRQVSDLGVLIDRFAEAGETDFGKWWGRLEAGERAILKRTIPGISVTALSARERRKARALVDRGLLVEKNLTFRMEGLAWKRFVEDA